MAEFKFPPGASGAKTTAPNGMVYVWDDINNRWAIEATPGEISAIVTISNNEPGDKANGDLWYNTSVPNNDRLYVKNGTWEQVAPGYKEYLAGIDNLQESVSLIQKEIEKLGQVVNQSVDYKLIKDKNDTATQLNDGGFYFGDLPNGNLLEVPDDWSGIGFIYVDTLDINGDFADFGPDTLDQGDLIEGVSDTGYFLVEVGQGGYDVGAGKKIAGIQASLIKATGVPGDHKSAYKLTAFRLTSTGGIDLPTADERYVQVAGDTMTGKLETRNKIWIRPDNKGANGSANMLVVNQQDQSNGSIARFQKNETDVVKIEWEGNINCMGNPIKGVANPTKGTTEAVNAKYMEDNTVQGKSGDNLKMYVENNILFAEWS
tara:strand:+ start:4005 stop:5126 length:1122 start_codon:yes stop_codon:yes gene_type:complete